MQSEWIGERPLRRALQRHEAFWDGTLDDGPLLWLTVPGAKPAAGPAPREPEPEERLWTEVDYVLAAAGHELSRTHYAGDALPVHNPWLGPDQFAAWLGAGLTLAPRLFTSWVTPIVEDWSRHPRFRFEPDNRWWRLYLELVEGSVRAGRGKWVTAYPDLHSGIDGLAALRGPENLLADLLERPDEVLRVMPQMTALFKEAVDRVSALVLPAGQGTSNWTMGWSARRFVCVGQNDFSCMISPQMFAEFCLEDTRRTIEHADRSIYHLDGPGAVRHLPMVLEIGRLDCVQWIQGAGAPLPSRWLDLLRSIQAAGKSVQVYYGPGHGGEADLAEELEILCRGLDPDRLFFWAQARSVEEAEELVRRAGELRRAPG